MFTIKHIKHRGTKTRIYEAYRLEIFDKPNQMFDLFLKEHPSLDSDKLIGYFQYADLFKLAEADSDPAQPIEKGDIVQILNNSGAIVETFPPLKEDIL